MLSKQGIRTIEPSEISDQEIIKKNLLVEKQR